MNEQRDKRPPRGLGIEGLSRERYPVTEEGAAVTAGIRAVLARKGAESAKTLRRILGIPEPEEEDNGDDAR